MPNHAGVADAAENPAWWDVLEHGPKSPFAHWFDIDWARAPKGTTTVPITVAGAGRSVVVDAVVRSVDLPVSARRGFVEAGGYVSMAAEHGDAGPAAGVSWRQVPELGMTPFPGTAASRTAGAGPPPFSWAPRGSPGPGARSRSAAQAGSYENHI